jgi:hypothetical protein
VFTNTVFLQDECEESVQELFEREIADCKCEDGSIVTLKDGSVYNIIRLEVSGTQPKSIGFFRLEIE